MLVHILRNGVRTDKLGKLPVGKVVEMDDHIALDYMRKGAVERYNTKVIKQVPLSDAGEVIPSSALPAAPVLPVTTSKPSRRGRRKKNAP